MHDKIITKLVLDRFRKIYSALEFIDKRNCMNKIAVMELLLFALPYGFLIATVEYWPLLKFYNVDTKLLTNFLRIFFILVFIFYADKLILFSYRLLDGCKKLE